MSNKPDNFLPHGTMANVNTMAAFPIELETKH